MLESSRLASGSGLKIGIPVSVIIVLLTGMLFMSGCMEATDPSTENLPVTISIEGLEFNPDELEIPVGTEVVWVNETSAIHTVTSGSDATHDGNFRSGSLSPGERFSFTFDEPGTYDYFCSNHLHAGETGVIIVTGS